MLTGFVKPTKPEKEELELERAAAQDTLFGYQMKIKEAGLPVMVIFEGWGTAGKGSMIRRVIRNIDPRFFKVFTMDAEPTAEEKRYPFLHRYLQAIPEAGKFSVSCRPCRRATSYFCFSRVSESFHSAPPG